MKNSLNRRVQTFDSSGNVESVYVNIWDINKKEIVFNGNITAAANFLKIHPSHLSTSLKRKHRIKKQYAVRIASQKTKG